MFIKSIELENWKCFAKKVKFNFKKHELINMKNGTGKTSIFQAIVFAICNKTPTGFNLNTIRNDPNKSCRIFISFDLNINGQIHEATIERIFGGSNLSELRIDGQLICESVRSIENYMNKLLNFNIVNQLWTQSLIDSDILRDDFFTKTLLNDILKEPLYLINYYSSEIYTLNRQINSYKFDQILDINEIQNNINYIKKKLKNRANGEINAANEALNASINLEKIKYKCNKLIQKGLTLELANKYKILFPQKKNIEENLQKELHKENNIYSKFNKNELKKIISLSKELNKCIICNSYFDENHEKELINKISAENRSEEKINEYKEQLKLLNNFTLDDINLIIEMYEYEKKINSCPNYKEIINNYNEENEKLWKEFEELQEKYNKALKQQEDLKKVEELKSKLIEAREKKELINNYVKDATNYYTSNLLNKATQYFQTINSRYKQICMYDGAFHVVVEDENLSLNLLPIARLSNGEKTMYALSLLFAIHNMLAPELPLLFDETFAALDRENLEQVQKFLKQQDTQIFVITHDKNWNEF